MRYTVILEKEDDGYVAMVPVLPGCVFQGDTRDEVIANIREAAELYIEDCVEHGGGCQNRGKHLYCSARAVTRSTWSAFRAGIRHAPRATAAKKTLTTTKVVASVGATSNSIC